MPVLPYWDHLDDFNRAQKTSFATFTYFTALLFVALFCLAIYNHIVFLLKPLSWTKLLAPLSIFYILAILTIVLRIFSIFFWIWALFKGRILLVALPPLFKLNVGLMQAWIMIELKMRVN